MEAESSHQLRNDEHTAKRELVTCLHGSFVDNLEVLEAESLSSAPGQRKRAQHRGAGEVQVVSPCTGWLAALPSKSTTDEDNQFTDTKSQIPSSCSSRSCHRVSSGTMQ